jgi:hypothetical protein
MSATMTKLTKDEIEDNLIEAVITETDDIFMKLYDSYPQKDKNDCRRKVFLHNMMFDCMVHLYDHDYSVKQIINEAFSAFDTYLEIIDDLHDEEDQD